MLGLKLNHVDKRGPTDALFKFVKGKVISPQNRRLAGVITYIATISHSSDGNESQLSLRWFWYFCQVLTNCNLNELWVLERTDGHIFTLVSWIVEHIEITKWTHGKICRKTISRNLFYTISIATNNIIPRHLFVTAQIVKRVWLLVTPEQLFKTIEVLIPASRTDFRLTPTQWETSLQSNAVSHRLGTDLESAVWLSIIFSFHSR